MSGFWAEDGVTATSDNRVGTATSRNGRMRTSKVDKPAVREADFPDGNLIR